MSKLTPKQAFEYLKAVFPWLKEIARTSHSTRTILIGPTSPGVDIETHEIDWGKTKSYKPEKWRTATIDDVKKSFDNKIECRCQGDSGFFLCGGYIDSQGSLICEVQRDGCTVRIGAYKVEILEEVQYGNV